MKSALMICLFGPLLAIAATAQDLSSIRMEATIAGKAEYGANKNSKTQTRQVTIEVTNTSESPVKGAVVKWAVYGHTMKDNQLKLMEDGEKKVTIPARGTITVKSTVVKFAGNREHSVAQKPKKKGKSKGKKAKVTYKKVPAAGEDYYGYGVEVEMDGKIAASQYSKPSIEDDMNPHG